MKKWGFFGLRFSWIGLFVRMKGLGFVGGCEIWGLDNRF